LHLELGHLGLVLLALLDHALLPPHLAVVDELLLDDEVYRVAEVLGRVLEVEVKEPRLGPVLRRELFLYDAAHIEHLRVILFEVSVGAGRREVLLHRPPQVEPFEVVVGVHVIREEDDPCVENRQLLLVLEGGRALLHDFII